MPHLSVHQPELGGGDDEHEPPRQLLQPCGRGPQERSLRFEPEARSCNGVSWLVRLHLELR